MLTLILRMKGGVFNDGLGQFVGELIETNFDPKKKKKSLSRWLSNCMEVFASFCL